MKSAIKKIKSILAISTIAILFASCQKEEVAGPAGPQGPQGAPGNANVHSYSWTTTSSNWGWSSSEYWYNDLTISQLTTDIYNYGAVMVYRKSGSDWYALPRTQNSGSTSLEERFIFNIGTLRVLWQYGDGQSYSNPGSRTFKVVLINGSRLAEHPGIDLSNYEEVKSAFNLKD